VAAEVRFLSAAWLRALLDAYGDLPREPGVSVVVDHTVTGGPDGDVGYWTRFEDGRLVDAGPGGHADATVTITVPYALAAELVTGRTDPAAAFMQGRSKVSGDHATLLRLLGLMATPAHRTATSALGARTGT
jgi:hypothetical protein